MPAGTSRKRERQYEHIKESYQERGVSKGEAEERAGSDGEQGAPQERRDQEEALIPVSL